MIARLPRAWNNPAYRLARHHAAVSGYQGLPLPAESEQPGFPGDLPPGWVSGHGQPYPWDQL